MTMVIFNVESRSLTKLVLQVLEWTQDIGKRNAWLSMYTLSSIRFGCVKREWDITPGTRTAQCDKRKIFGQTP